MDWGEIVEQKIREAIAKGEFEDLPGKGKPVPIEEYPFTPPEWRLAFKILADAGFVPDWIALDGEIRERMERWHSLARQFTQERDEALASSSAYARRIGQRLWERRRSWLAREVEEINRLIELFNLKVPIKWLQRRKFKPEL